MTNTATQTPTPLTARTLDARATEALEFGLADQRGRAIGAQIETALVTFTALPASATSGYRHAPGTYFALCVQATRNGRHYGAAQPWRYFATEAERAQALAAYLMTARRRASAKAAS